MFRTRITTCCCSLWQVAPANGGALDVFSSYAHATGLPAPLLESAALFWQSKSTYHTQDEVVEVAKNFASRNLTVGEISYQDYHMLRLSS